MGSITSYEMIFRNSHTSNYAEAAIRVLKEVICPGISLRFRDICKLTATITCIEQFSVNLLSLRRSRENKWTFCRYGSGNMLLFQGINWM